jgi:uncharacterized membrane protein YoaK (UPF0700 family)
VLSLVGGSTDAIGFLSLNGLFTAHITGNLVVLAAHVVAGDPVLLSYILSVPVFMLVLLLARVFASRLERRGVATLRPLLWVEFLLLTAFLVLCVAHGRDFSTRSVLAVVAGMLGVAAMAVQNALVQISLPQSPSTAVMTTNVTRFMLAFGEVVAGGDSARVALARKRAVQLLPVIVGFAAGCALGAAAQARFGWWALSFPAVMALLAVAMSGTAERRGLP